MGILYLIGVKYIFEKIFTALNQVLVVQSQFRGFWKANL